MVVVGAASRDLTEADPRGWRLGGAVTYAALTLARLGLPVRALVGVDALASAATELELLRAAGVEVELVDLARGPVFVNEERPGGRVQRCVEASDPLDVGALPATWRDPAAMFLGPVAGELGAEWASVPLPAAVVALGWQGLLRRLVPGEPVAQLAPAAHPLLRRADLVGVSDEDVGADTPLRRLVDLIKVGATLVVTRGARGGISVTSRRPARSLLRVYPAIPSNGFVDPTGAGDVFLATLFGARLAGEPLVGRDAEGSAAMPLPAALQLAAAAGSLAIEGIGLAGVPRLAAVRRRVADVA